VAPEPAEPARPAEPAEPAEAVEHPPEVPPSAAVDQAEQDEPVPEDAPGLAEVHELHPQANDPAPTGDADLVDPDPMAPRPVLIESTEGDDQSLSDLLFRPPSDAASAEPSGGRIDDLVFAWPASGFQKLPPVEGEDAGRGTGDREQPEPTDAPTGTDEGDDEPPRDDLEFL
jgi:hypothetical protein